MVTEPIFASVANALGQLDNISHVPKELKGMVRVNALRCLGDLVSTLDNPAVFDIMLALQQCTAVDHSAPTLMCTLGVANSIYKQCLSKLTEPNSSTKSRPSWDEDWGPTVKKTGNTSLPVEVSHQPERTVPILQKALIADIPLRSITAVSSQQTSTCTPVDVEWPPLKSHSEFGAQLGVNENQNAMGTSNSSFDYLDRFANWPPRSSNSASSLATVNAPNQSYGISGPGMSSLGFSSSTSIGQSKAQNGSLISNLNNQGGLPMNSQSFGQLKHPSASGVS